MRKIRNYLALRNLSSYKRTALKMLIEKRMSKLDKSSKVSPAIQMAQRINEMEKLKEQCRYYGVEEWRIKLAS